MRKVKKNQSWEEKAAYRQENADWLLFAFKIALRIKSALEDKDNLSQTELAKLIDVKPQYISRIIKGEENLTLKTIAKLAKSLEVELISFPDFKYSMPLEIPTRPKPLIDSSVTAWDTMYNMNKQKGNLVYVKPNYLGAIKNKVEEDSNQNVVLSI